MMNNSFIELPDLDSAFLVVGFLPFKNQPEGSIFSEPEGYIIAEDDRGILYYSEAPASLFSPGDAVLKEDCHPFCELPKEIQEEYRSLGMGDEK